MGVLTDDKYLVGIRNRSGNTPSSIPCQVSIMQKAKKIDGAISQALEESAAPMAGAAGPALRKTKEAGAQSLLGLPG